MTNKLEKSVVKTVNVARSGAEQAIDLSNQHKTARNFLAGVLMVACLILGSFLIFDWYTNLPPDANDGDVEDAVKFVQSDAYYRLNDDDRQVYFETTMKRVSKLPKEQRRILREKLTPKKDEDQKSTRAMWMKVMMDYAKGEAKKYINTPEDERDKYLKSRMGTWSQMFSGMGGGPPRRGSRAEGQGGGPRGANGERSGERSNMSDKDRRAEGQKRMIKFMRENMLPNTTAQERSQIMYMMSDIGKRQRDARAKENAKKPVDKDQL